MKISEAKKIYSTQLDALWSRKKELTKILKEDMKGGTDSPNYDRVELSKELSEVEEQYSQTQDFMEQLTLRETCIHNAAVAKQQGEAIGKAMDNMMKCLEIARRISSGAKVPSADEKMLMEYSHELYMAAKNLSFMQTQEKQKEYDTLVEEEEQAETKSASEIAGDAEVALELPEITETPVATE